jgi:hypothetical protein
MVGEIWASNFSFIGYGQSLQLHLTINICSVATATGLRKGRLHYNIECHTPYMGLVFCQGENFAKQAVRVTHQVSMTMLNRMPPERAQPV